MPFSLFPPSPETLRAEAKALREERAAAGSSVSHAQALEETARNHGYRDWNTAIASLKEPVGCPVVLGQQVSGHYLKQPFTGRVLAVAILPGGNLYRLTIHFDAPVDVVTFESFSSLRTRVNCRVNPYGVSPDTTSDGQPHMRLNLGRGV